MIIPVYLTDDDGNLIEQSSSSGDYIIIGYVNQDLFSNTSGELRNTFVGIVEGATPEQKAEVIRGLRLAKNIRGRLNRFELSGTPNNAYVKYNHSIFGGRFQSQYTALGAIAGTYLRRGGTAFSKELVEKALVTGPFANFPTTFPSLELPGDVELSVNAGGGTLEAFAWTITDGTTTFSPTVQNPTVTLTEGTWTASVIVTIDGENFNVAPQSFDVAVFSASSMAPDILAPALGEVVTFSMADAQNGELLDSVDWSFTSAPTKVEVSLTQSDTSFRSSSTAIDIPLVEGVDYEIVTASSPATSISVRFLTGGEFHAQAVARHSDSSQAVAFSSVDVTPTGSFGTFTDNHRMSTATADALYSGDTHVVVLGDSLMNPFARDRFAEGIRTQWKPARWAGLQHGVSQIGSGLYYARSGSQTDAQGSANINRDGTNSSGAQITGTEVATAQYSPLASGRGEWTLDAGTLSNAVRARVKQSGETVEAVGRLQGTDTFDNVAGTQTSMLLVGVDTGLTLDVSSPGTVEAASVTLTADQYATVAATWNPTGSTDQEPLALGWTGQTAGDKFGLIDIYTYNPNISGLSVSYMGDGGWNIANHAGPYALNENGVEDVSTHANSDEWYDDRAIEEHLKLYAYSDLAQTKLRDNIVIIIENQNGTGYGYTNAVRLALSAVRSRWETAANNLDPSGTLWSRIQFVFMTLPELYWAESHESFAAQARDFIGVGGYDWCELIDLNQQLLEYAPGDGLDYSDPKTYTDIYWDHDSNGSTSRILLREADLADGSEWYSGGDMVHPQQVGSYVAMSEFWNIVEAAATAAGPVSGTVTASATTALSTDTLTFTIPDKVAETDHVVVWLDQASNELGRGASLVTTLASTVTRVDARIITASGADEILTGPALTITDPNSAPVFTIQPRLEDDEEPIIEGGPVAIQFRAADSDGGTLEYFVDGVSIGSFTQGTAVDTSVTASTAGVLQTVNVTVSDGTETVAATPLTFTPDASNTAPVISFALNLQTTGGTQVGNQHTVLAFVISDAEDALADLTAVASVSYNGGVDWTEIGTVAPNASGVASVTFTTVQSGDHLYRFVVTDTGGLSTTRVASSVLTVDPLPANPVATFAPDGDGTVNVIDASSFDDYIFDTYGDGDTINKANVTDMHFFASTWMVRFNYDEVDLDSNGNPSGAGARYNGQNDFSDAVEKGYENLELTIDGTSYLMDPGAYEWRLLNGDSIGVLEGEQSFDPAVDNTLTRVSDGVGFTHASIASLIGSASSISVEIQTVTPDGLFGTPDYVATQTPGSGNPSVSIDNINAANDIGINQVLNGARARLYNFNATDRSNVLVPYLTNNPNAIYVIVMADGTFQYYLENSTHTGDRWTSSGFHDLQGDGWRLPSGEAINGAIYPGGAVELRIYPGT